MANPDHPEVAKNGAKAIALWRRSHPGERMDLTRANLSGAELTSANLSMARLIVVNFPGADLSGAALTFANFSGADLIGAIFTGARLGRTVFGDCDLSQCLGLE